MGKVGYDMYCKLLKEAVSELQGEKVKEKKEIKMEIELSAYIPEEYIVSESERIKKYAEISEITTLEALHTFEKSLSVSYGGVPEVVQNIMLVALLKNLAQKQDVKKVVINSGFSKLYLYKQESVISEKLAKVLDENKHIAVLKFAEMPIIEFKMKGNVKDNLKQIISLLI